MTKLFLCIFRRFMGIFRIKNNMFFSPCFAAARLSRSTERSTGPKTREQSSLAGRPLGRPCLEPGKRAQACTRRSTVPVDRLWVRSTGRSTARACQALFWVRKLGLKNIVKIPIKFLKIHKNSF